MHRTEKEGFRKSSPVTFVIAFLCLIITLPGVFSENYYELFSAELPHEYWWQRYTGAFQHGRAGEPIAIVLHLAGNMFLLFTAGTLSERLLGTVKFTLLTLSAWLGFMIAEWWTGIWVNGSSGIIWAYSPFLLFYLRHPDEAITPAMVRGLLIFMWAIATLLMGFLPRLFNTSHTFLHSFLAGNLFHVTGVMIGFLLYFSWRKTFEEPSGNL